MVDSLIGLITGLGPWSYVIIFVGATHESAAFLGLFVPGETLTIVGGVLAQAGLLDLGRVTAAVTVGAIAGDSIG